MEENKDLTPEDKVRIEQEAIIYTDGHGSTHKNWRGFLKGAEYATLYERHECDKIIERATSDSMDTIVMLDQKVKSLEAERAEVRNKVIEEMTIKLDERLSEHVQHEGDYIAVRISELQEITNLLNSLKTK